MREKSKKIEVCEKIDERSKHFVWWQIIYFYECWIFFGCTPFYLGNMIYLAKILRALLINKKVFVFLQKVNN